MPKNTRRRPSHEAFLRWEPIPCGPNIEVANGKRSDSSFKKEAWENVCKAVCELAGMPTMTDDQIKNKYN